MKATLAFVACLLTAGFLTAAEVAGNNIAVVIRKKVVESDTGFQFLCVPVDGLDIANGNQKKTVKLSTLLPASTLNAGTTISFVGGTLGKDKATATVTEDENTKIKSWSTELELPGGQIYWLNVPNAVTVTSFSARRGGTVTTYGQTTNNDTVIFCGQNRARDELTSLDSGVTALKNDSSQEITLDQAVNMQGFTPNTNDQILTIKAGTAEYKIYTCDEDVWYGEGFGEDAIEDAENARIAPGEAFYYFRATAN